jgi:hypothetical protein
MHNIIPLLVESPCEPFRCIINLHCSTHHEGMGVAWYTLLVWLGEAQLVNEVTQWLANVIVYGSGNEQEEVIRHMTFPAENQTANEFVHQLYFGFSLFESRTDEKCRGNLEQGDIPPVDESKIKLVGGGHGSLTGRCLFTCERPGEREDGEISESDPEEFPDDDEGRCRGCGTMDCDCVVLEGFPCPTHDDD